MNPRIGAGIRTSARFILRRVPLPRGAFTLIELLVVIAIIAILACDLNQWAEPSGGSGWVIAPHGANGAALQGGSPFIDVKTLTTSLQAGGKGGNILLLDGSVSWKNLRQSTNYAASQFGGGYWNAW